jgi:hypothetical protein
MRFTLFEVPVLRDIIQGLSILFLRICGWHRDGKPDACSSE